MAAAATGAELLWRVRKDIVLAVMQQLRDGSYLSEIFDQRDIHRTRPGVRVQVVEYTIAGRADVYRLITTILDPTAAPAADMACLYAQRWEFESTLDEIKTHLGRSHLVLRSQYPDGATQELNGFLLVHHAIRTLMHQEAREGDHDPDRISFIRAVGVVRRQATDQAAFSPADSPAPSRPPSLNCCSGYCHHDGDEPTPASSNERRRLAPQTRAALHHPPPARAGSHHCPSYQTQPRQTGKGSLTRRY